MSFINILTPVVLTIIIVFGLDYYVYGLGRRSWDRFVSVFLLTIAQITATEMLLGSIGNLNSLSLVITNVCISTYLIWRTRKKPKSNSVYSHLLRSKYTVNNLWEIIRYDRYLIVLMVLATILLSWVVFLGLIFPVADWDGLAYHMTYVANVIQSSSIHDLPTDIAWLTGYPKGAEMLQLWTVILAGNEIFADLMQVPFVIAGIYALYTISINLGIKSEVAKFNALLFLFTPFIVNQMITTYVDTMLISAFFIAIAIITKKSFNRHDYLLIGIVFGLLLSIKSSGALLVAVLAPYVIWSMYKGSSKPGFKNFNFQNIVSLIVPMTIGAYWYIKNWVLYGSPLYPFGISVGGYQIFNGESYNSYLTPYVNSLPNLPTNYGARIWQSWTEQYNWFGCLYNYDSMQAGLGPIWFILLLPASFVGLLIVIKKRKYNILYFYIAILTAFLLYPFNFNPRYSGFIILLGIIGLGLVMQMANTKIKSLIKMLAIVLSIIVMFSTYSVCLRTPETIGDQIKYIQGGGQGETLYSRIPGRAFEVLKQEQKPGDKVTYGSPIMFPYGLWKEDFSNQVLYKKYDDSWAEWVMSNNVDYVFNRIVDNPNHLSSKIRQASIEEGYELIYRDDQYEIFKVR